ncbi:MAG: class I SAM-dependent methyltransferase [Pseudonocardiaceae bacterium]
MYLSALGYDVYGLDCSPRAVEQARANAAARNVEVHFQVADALALGDDTTTTPSSTARCSTSSTRTTAPDTCAVCTASAGRARLCTSWRCQRPGPASDRRSATPRSARPSANDGYWKTWGARGIEAQSSATSTL